MQYYTFYILYDNIYSINTMKITFEIFYSVKKRESLVNCDIQALNKIRTRYKNWPYLVFIAMLPTVETRIVINDVVAGAHYDVEVIRANAELLCICGSQPSWERLYHGSWVVEIQAFLVNTMCRQFTGLGERAARSAREVTALARSRLSLVVGVRMRYLAAGTQSAKFSFSGRAATLYQKTANHLFVTSVMLEKYMFFFFFFTEI